MSVTLKHIAELAGVHPSTVSRVVNGGYSRVGEETRKRILELARVYNYKPNAVARSLKLRKTQVLGMLIPDITNPFFSTVFLGALDRARQDEFSVILGNTSDEPEKQDAYTSTMRELQVDGLIIATARRYDERLVQLQQQGVPFVLVNRHTEVVSGRSVIPDNISGIEYVVEHLVGLGHKRVAQIVGHDSILTSVERARSFRQAVHRRKLDADPALMVESPLSENGGYEAAMRLLSLDRPPTAICAMTDLQAVGVLQAIRQKGLRVPQDLSVVGFNDIRFAHATCPPLTTVRLPAYRMGLTATGMLLSQIRGEAESEPQVVLPVELIVRESTGPAPGSTH